MDRFDKKIRLEKYLLPCLFLFFGTNQAIGNNSVDTLSSSEGPLAVVNNSESEFTAVHDQIFDWIKGTHLGDDALEVSFTTSNAIISAFAKGNNICSLKVKVHTYKQDKIILEGQGSFQFKDDQCQSNQTPDIETWVVTINPADLLNGDYRITLSIDGNPFCDPRPLEIIDPTVPVEEPEDVPYKLPEFNCGDELPDYTITNQQDISEVELLDIIFIRGFPIQIMELTTNKDHIRGEGLMQVPFGRKSVRVKLDVRVNTDMNVFAGMVEGISDDLAEYPNCTGIEYPIVESADICVEPDQMPGFDAEGINEVTGLDAWGFNPDGTHPSTGTIYDPNGFRQDGTFKDTGSEFNDQGCSRRGYQEDGTTPCEPAAGAFPKSENFADQQSETIEDDIESELGNLRDQYNDTQILSCQQIRDELLDLTNPSAGGVSVDVQYLFGENSEYLNDDMHLHFTDAPQKLQVNIKDRDNRFTEIENKHIELYECDRQRYANEKLIEAIDVLLADQNGEISEASAELLEKIKQWTEFEYNGNKDDFESWLTKEIEALIRELSGLDDSYGYNDSQTPSITDPQTELRKYFNFSEIGDVGQLVSTGTDFLDLNNSKNTKQEISFLLEQGEEYIFGLHRAYFLEELQKQQQALFGQESDHLLPICVPKVAGNKTIEIILDDLEITPNEATLAAYVILDDPETNNRFVMCADRIGFGVTGLVGPSELKLGSDVEIKLNNTAKLILLGGQCRVIWDCEGFQEAEFAAEVEICRNFIVPIDPNTLKPEEGEENYKMSIPTFKVTDWFEFWAEADAPYFQLASQPDVIWQVKGMTLDFLSKSSPNFKPLGGYSSPFVINNVVQGQWKGFHMEKFEAIFTNELSNDGEPLKVEARDIVVDGTGVSGIADASELPNVGINEGSMANWPISIDRLFIKVLHNNLCGGGFGGKLKIPIFDGELEYAATIFPGSQYSITVQPGIDQVLRADIFLADVVLDNNSMVKVGIVDGKFLAKATLNGTLDIKDIAEDIDIPNISFEGFEFSNRIPYFSPGKWGIKKEQSGEYDFKKFKFKIDTIAPHPTADPNEMALGIGMRITLSGDLKISAGGKFSVIGRIDDPNAAQHSWTFDRIKPSEFFVNAPISNVGHVSGLLRFVDESTIGYNPTYGRCFQGAVDFYLEERGVGFSAVGQFGHIFDVPNPYKYFYIDVLANLGQIGEATGIVQINGFGGGLAHNMHLTQGVVDFAGSAGSTPPDISTLPLGGTLSSNIYAPSGDGTLNLKASLMISILSKHVINGIVSYQMAFNEDFGINSVSYNGIAQVLSDDLAKLATLQPGDDHKEFNSALTGILGLTLDFKNEVLLGTLKAYLDAGPLEGAGDEKELIDAQLYISPEKWHLLIGEPAKEKRAGARLNIGTLGSIDALAYLNIGTDIPAFPDLPDEVIHLASNVRRNNDLRQSGRGFAMGASLTADLSVNVLGILKTSLDAGIGFDIMLKQYKDLFCAEELVGINGWYGSGQAWAFLHGVIALGPITILEAGFAAILQARLPSPFWAKGTVVAKIQIGFTLDPKIELEIGDDCDLNNDDFNGPLGMSVVSYFAPSDQSEQIEPSVQPEAYLSMELGRNYEADGDNFKATLIGHSLETLDGEPIETAIEESPSVIKFVPYYLLPANTTIVATVRIRVDKNGQEEFIEEASTTFITGDALDYIPTSNVNAIYPAEGMVNFYPSEYPLGKGFIELISGQPDLLYEVPEEYQQVVRLTNATTGSETTFSYEYYPLTNIITFDIDPASISAGGLHRLEIVRLSNESANPSGSPSENRDPQTEPSAGGIPSRSKLPDGVLYRWHFRASKYDKLQNKIDAIWGNQLNGVAQVSGDTELFDGLELASDGSQLLEMSIDQSSLGNWVDDVRIIYGTLESQVLNTHCANLMPTFDQSDYLDMGGLSYKSFGTAVDLSHYDQNSYSFPNDAHQVIRADLGNTATTFYQKELQALFGCIVRPSSNPNAPQIDDALINSIRNANIPAPDMLQLSILYRLPNGNELTHTSISY